MGDSDMECLFGRKPDISRRIRSRKPNRLRQIGSALARMPVILAFLAAALSLLAIRANAQPLQKSVAMVGARSGASWPLWIAKEARLYAKYGLDVELVYGVHPAPIAAIIAGQAAMTSSGSDEPPRSCA